MHRRVLVLGAAVAVIGALAAAAADEQAIREVLDRGYVDGVWKLRDPELVRQSFAPTFVMQVYWKGELSSRTLDQWLERMALDRQPRKSEIRAEIEVLQVTGIAGLARVELYEDGVRRFTDYFGLYTTDDGWKIVSKLFHPW